MANGQGVVEENNGGLGEEQGGKRKIGGFRHGPEVPKFVFMAIGFETYGHASRMAQLI